MEFKLADLMDADFDTVRDREVWLGTGAGTAKDLSTPIQSTAADGSTSLQDGNNGWKYNRRYNVSKYGKIKQFNDKTYEERVENAYAIGDNILTARSESNPSIDDLTKNHCFIGESDGTSSVNEAGEPEKKNGILIIDSSKVVPIDLGEDTIGSGMSNDRNTIEEPGMAGWEATTTEKNSKLGGIAGGFSIQRVRSGEQGVDYDEENKE